MHSWTLPIQAATQATSCHQITNAIAEHGIDILAVTETWQESSDDVTLKQVTPDGYICFDKARTRPISSSSSSRGDARRVTGGGTALIFRNVFKSKQIEFQFNPKTFEYVAGLFTLGTMRNIVVVIYRPGSQAASSAFFDELSNLLELLVTYNCGIIITGDLNIHLDVFDNTHTIRFNNVLEGFDLSQHITGPTHRVGHTLDVFITKTDQLVPIGTAVCHQVISDHSLIIATLPQSKPETVFFNATVRGWKKLDKKRSVAIWFQAICVHHVMNGRRCHWTTWFRSTRTRSLDCWIKTRLVERCGSVTDQWRLGSTTPACNRKEKHGVWNECIVETGLTRTVLLGWLNCVHHRNFIGKRRIYTGGQWWLKAREVPGSCGTHFLI